ncbi:MAG TPA: type IV pilin protein [Pirellulales bacterium]|jgi:prepilin-type N-terminal cleavage/methylation domain-containing protein
MRDGFTIQRRCRRLGVQPRRGISLIEIVMVTVIIGILASLTVPSFHQALEQSRADIASANLRAIWSAQRLYWLENRTYAVDLATLQSLDLLDSSISDQNFYTYEVDYATSTTFSASAMRVANQTWNGAFCIDQSGSMSGVLSGSGVTNIVLSY